EAGIRRGGLSSAEGHGSAGVDSALLARPDDGRTGHRGAVPRKFSVRELESQSRCGPHDASVRLGARHRRARSDPRGHARQAGIPTTTTARLAHVGSKLWFGVPVPVYIAVAATLLVTAVVKLTPAGRRFEGVGANETAALTSGIYVRRYRGGAYVWAQLLYCF